ncbi:MAG: type I-E CRISPR-associated endoribonuclease Cas2, partial [Bryobacteraceae bacterium]|nr:type I-E CRISPR-associated endoribonuclease Cas2 [Bryobacteraceae bacterium]
MVTIVMERVPPSVRGELSRWMLELHAGVFVGKISALVREELWAWLQPKLRNGWAVLVYSNNTEQGFSFEIHGS